MTTGRREEMLAAVIQDDGFARLRLIVEGLLNDGVEVDVVLEDLGHLRGRVSPEDEDKVLDVMDLLTGWCAPQFRFGTSVDGA